MTPSACFWLIVAMAARMFTQGIYQAASITLSSFRHPAAPRRFDPGLDYTIPSGFEVVMPGESLPADPPLPDKPRARNALINQAVSKASTERPTKRAARGRAGPAVTRKSSNCAAPEVQGS